MSGQDSRGYIDIVNSYRKQADRSLTGHEGISDIEDQLLVATNYIGSQISTMFVMFVVEEISAENFWFLVSKNFGEHINGYLNVIQELAKTIYIEEWILNAYASIENFERLSDNLNNNRIGRGIVLLLLLAIYLQEYWRTAPEERERTMPFPVDPVFIKRWYFELCVSKKEELARWIKSRQYLDSLNVDELTHEYGSL